MDRVRHRKLSRPIQPRRARRVNSSWRPEPATARRATLDPGRPSPVPRGRTRLGLRLTRSRRRRLRGDDPDWGAQNALALAQRRVSAAARLCEPAAVAAPPESGPPQPRARCRPARTGDSASAALVVSANAEIIASTSSGSATRTIADEFSGTSLRISSNAGPWSVGMWLASRSPPIVPPMTRPTARPGGPPVASPTNVPMTAPTPVSRPIRSPRRRCRRSGPRPSRAPRSGRYGAPR